MADKKTKLPVLQTPIGVAGFCNLDAPDTKGKFADNKYKLNFLLPKEGADNQDEINSFVKRVVDAHEKVGGIAIDCPMKDGSEAKDKDGKKVDSLDGFWVFKSKSIYPAVLADAARHVLPASKPIYSGDIVIVSFSPKTYRNGNKTGLTCYLKGVQLLKKGEGQSASPEELFSDQTQAWGENAANDGGDTTTEGEDTAVSAEAVEADRDF